MLGKCTFLDAHLAFATGEPPTTDALDAQAQIVSRLQHGCASGEMAAPPRGHKDHERAVVARIQITRTAVASDPSLSACRRGAKRT